MSDEDQKKIFAKNLCHYVYISGKQQKEIAEELNFNQKTFNGWCNGLSMPGMGKVQALADYFGIGKSDLLDEKNTLSKKGNRDIEKILDSTREQLLTQQGLMFDGDPATPEAIESILSAMQIGMEMAKKKNKEKYTPKKYKKD